MTNRVEDRVILSRLASAAVDTGRALQALNREKNRLEHSRGTVSTKPLEKAESSYRRHRKILAMMIRENAGELYGRGENLWTAMVSLRAIVANALVANRVATVVHESVLAETSSVCVMEYYSAAHNQ